MEEYEVTITYRVEVYNEDPLTMVQLLDMVHEAQVEGIPFSSRNSIGHPDFLVAGEVDHIVRGPLEQ